jgi:hypothetical protein
MGCGYSTRSRSYYVNEENRRAIERARWWEDQRAWWNDNVIQTGVDMSKMYLRFHEVVYDYYVLYGPICVVLTLSWLLFCFVMETLLTYRQVRTHDYCAHVLGFSIPLTLGALVEDTQDKWRQVTFSGRRKVGFWVFLSLLMYFLLIKQDAIAAFWFTFLCVFAHFLLVKRHLAVR